MNGTLLDNFKLDVRLSQRALDAGEQMRKEDRAKAVAATQTKVVVKNLPFEANKKDIRSLLSTFGRVKSVRLPKKFDSSSRGFAFAEFTSPKEASNAREALQNTHLLGRRLHIEYASAADLDPEAEIERMQKKVGSQVDKVAMQRLGNSERRKFAVEGGVEEG
jgi:multiple RNA-binding domain-containing protein 1